MPLPLPADWIYQRKVQCAVRKRAVVEAAVIFERSERVVSGCLAV